MIYTSYYGKLSRKDVSDVVLVQVSNTKPDWFPHEVVNWSKLAPDWRDINAYREGALPVEMFKERYIGKLNSQYNKDEIISDIYTLMESGNVILLCWEKTGQVCHREWLSEWLDIGIAEMN